VILMSILGQPRIFYAMSQDGLLPPVFRRVHPKYKTPYVGTVITGAIAAATGVNTVVQGCNVLVPDRVLQVSVDCTGAFLFVAYAALVIAQPLSWRDRLLGIALGVPVLIAFNIGRLVLVAHVSQWMPNQFDLMHDFLFQGLMVLSALVVWLVWMSTVTRRAERTACV
jgi:APA family basic amino acid/polyamine antiporter